MLIPKVVHVSWKSKDILDNQSPLILNGIRNIVDMNSDWKLEISDNEDVEKYLCENLSRNDFELLSYRHIVEKTDVWRLLKIINEGGMYIDIDRPLNKVLSKIIDPNIKCVLPINGNYDFSQDLMISCSQNPLHIEALRLNLERRKAGINNIYYLGAQTYMHGITSLLYGRMVDVDPGVEIMQNLKDILSQISFIQTYVELLPNDTFVYKHDLETYKQGNGKTKIEFYQEFDVKHWET